MGLFLAFYLVPLVCISVFVLVSYYLDDFVVRKLDSSSFILLSQDCFGCSASFVFPYSVIPSSCEMKYEPAFQPLQGYQPSFESGHLGVHSNWGRKHRVPLTYLFLREGSSLGACETLAYLFSRRQGIILIPRWYGVHGTFLNLLYWNWWSSILETVVSGSL